MSTRIGPNSDQALAGASAGHRMAGMEPTETDRALASAERAAAFQHVVQLEQHPIDGRFDFAHLQAIHRPRSDTRVGGRQARSRKRRSSSNASCTTV